MKGIWYWHWKQGFSLNEGRVPNICVQWDGLILFLYVCWGEGKRWHRGWLKPWKRVR